MAFMNAEERALAENLTGLMYTNPFLPEWVELEKRVLGKAFVDEGPVWSVRVESQDQRVNMVAIDERMNALAEKLRARLEKGPRPSDADLALYDDLVVFMIYEQVTLDFLDLTREMLEGRRSGGRIEFYGAFAERAQRFLSVGGLELPSLGELAHLFACFFQIRRAFHHIFTFIVGGSMPTAQLRAAVWQSIFTHDIHRYRRSLYARMGELTTLITGPSGTGKELVARAIGMARYVPFDEHSRTFTEDFSTTFHPLNLSAMSPTLIESELFGHKKGAYTGALSDRAGWLELCPPVGSVFLDEIGDLNPAIQVKLLRVLETRRFQRLGESITRSFSGKIIAATNRDLREEIAAGRFRRDLYYRLCADTVRTPGLSEQIADSPAELRNLVYHLAIQIAGEDEAESLCAEVLEHIGRDLGADYFWPGNIRELAQCIRNVLVRREYRPSEPPPACAGACQDFARQVASGSLSAEELLSKYATLVYFQAGTYEEAARRLGIDRRTVKARVDPELLEGLKEG
jgi:transcriptional regulator with AAA-type ATPase domain